ncbi:ATPase AAA [soil metagenome]
MRRIVVLGCSGSGKSTLSRRLGARLGLPVVHLDALYWAPGWTPRPLDEFRARVATAVSGDGWVCDGGYSNTHDLRFPFADTVIWLDRPRALCLWRVVLRWLGHLGRTRVDMGEGCPEKIDLEFVAFIWNWRRVSRPKIEASLARYAPDTPRIVLTSDRDVDRFLKSLN